MKRASSSQDHDILKILQEMKSLPSEYPPELLSARRSAFMDQLDMHTQPETAEGYQVQDHEVVERLRKLRSMDGPYPAPLMAARRSTFARQIAWFKLMRYWTSLQNAIRDRFAAVTRTPVWKGLGTSLVLASLALAVMLSFFTRDDQTQSFSPPLSPARGVSRSAHMVAMDTRESRIICKTGYSPPLCLAGEYKKKEPLTYQGNGYARPAVAKDTFPGFGDIYRAAFVNDGMYGPGASWISNSPNSWIKIDLGKVISINTVTFGRDRLLGDNNDRDPGQFVIQVATSDNVYADGNNSNDSLEYTEVFDSEQTSFNGSITGAETVTAQFDLQSVRYIKITFENQGTAIDEVEAFMVEPPLAASEPTRDRDDDEAPGSVPTVASTITAVVVDTATPVPTSTPTPTDTPLPTPTDTPAPTDTPLPTPTDTALPEPTEVVPHVESTSMPEPVDISQTQDWPPGLEKNTIRPTRNPHNQ